MRSKKYLRLAAIVLAAAAVVQLCGCATLSDLQSGASMSQIMDSLSADIFGEEEQTYTQITVTLPRHSGYAAIEDKTAFAALDSEEERQAYLSMEQSAFCITEEPGDEEGVYRLCRAQIPNLNSVQIFKVKEAVLADHPEAFWLNGDYTLGSNAHDGLYVTLFSSMNAEEIESRAAALAERVSYILRQIKSGLNEYDRELLIHDCIVRDVQYDEEAAANISPNDEAATVYGALVNGRAICTGYAKSVKLLLNRVGISCMTVKGICREEGHMWNLVSVDGSWYHMDATWDDPAEFSAFGLLSRNYFNLTDAQISSNHDISDDYVMMTMSKVEEQGSNAQNFYNFDLPECGSDDANYYVRNAVYVNRLNETGKSAVIAALRLRSLTASDMLYIVFPEEMEDEVVEDWVNSAMLDGILTINTEAAENGTGSMFSSYKYSSVTEDNWCNAYIIKLLFHEQPIS